MPRHCFCNQAGHKSKPEAKHQQARSQTSTSPKPNINKPEAKHKQARSQSAPGLLYACFMLALFQLLLRLKGAAALHHAGNQNHNHGSHCGPQNRSQVEVRDALREKVRTR